MSIVAKRSFTGGEIAPELMARVDTVKYQTGVEIMRNMWAMKSSGTQNRPGSQYVSEIHKDSTKGRLIPFVFNNNQSYVLEFGHLYMRVIKDGAPLLRPDPITISGISNANPCVVTAVAHDILVGTVIYIPNSGGIPEIQGQYFIATVTGLDTLSLSYLDGTAVNSTAFGTFSGSGSLSELLVFPTSYDEDDLMELKFVQSADVMTVVHKDYPPTNISRVEETSWDISQISFRPGVDGPEINGSSVSGGTAFYNKYVVTSVSYNGEESTPPKLFMEYVTSITNANPARVKLVSNLALIGLIDGDEVYFDFVNGMTEVNGKTYIVDNISGDEFDLLNPDGTNVDSTSYGVHTASTGSAFRPYLRIGSNAALSSTNFNTININHPTLGPGNRQTDVKEYNIYREDNGVYGFVGTAKYDNALGGTIFRDRSYDTDPTSTPSEEFDGFSAANEYPSCVTYIQSRLALSGVPNDPERVYLSRVGDFYNFTTRTPVLDDDSINFPVAGQRVNAVQDMIDLGKFIVLTSGGEWLVGGEEAITPSTVSAKQQTANGSSSISPVLADGSAIYVQARGSIIRDLAFNFDADGYRGNDISIFASHLFEGYSIVDMAYQLTPNSIVWLVRDDGVLLGLTYIRDQQILGWHRHDVNGLVKSICVIPEGSEDVLYLLVERELESGTRLHIERLATRIIDDQKDMIFMDSARTYDGRNTNDAHTMDLSGGTEWDESETLTLTSSTSFFKSYDVGNEIHIFNDDDIVRLEITGYTSGTVVSVVPNKTVIAALRTSTSSWSRAVDSLIGLWNLEGSAVSVLGDGNVVASPNNEEYDVITVNNGTVTLDRCYSVIQVGLPYLSDIKTLEIDTDGSETLASKKKIVNVVGMRLLKTRGVWIGPSEPSDDSVDPTENLSEMMLTGRNGYDESIGLFTGNADVIIRGEWSRGGQIFIRQVDPLPMTILACNPNMLVKGA